MKSKLKNLILSFTTLLLISTMIFSCAQQQSTLTGGEKDTIAPVLKKSTPEIASGYFDGKVVKIRFDEYFSLDKIDQTFLMSPPQDSVRPKIKVRGKWLIVKFKEPLRQDTTYTLQFFDAVKDFNENNPIRNFQFTFSTGNTVDSLAISGRVVDAELMKVEPDMLVALYGERSGLLDSAFIKYKPDYITRTDTIGRFRIPNVRPGRYKIYALKDINETQRFDLENEKIAFLKTVVVPKSQRYYRIDSLWAGTILHKGEKGHRYLDTLLRDTVIIQDILHTTPNNITLYSFEEKHVVQYISERQRDIRQRINLIFNKSVEQDSIVITYVDDTLKSPKMTYDFNYYRDTLMVWLRDTADINNDTLQLRITFATVDSLKQPTLETDTISVKFSNKKKAQKGKDNKQKDSKTKSIGIDSLNFTIKSNFSGDFDLNGKIKISVPILYEDLDTSLIKLYECADSTFEEDKNQKILKSMRLDSAEYRVIFKRPILGDIVWYPLDSIVRTDWYIATYSANRDTVDIEVVDSAMISKSKFSNMLKYHNDYYLGQVQKIRDSINTVIIDQKRIKLDRPSRDTIKILFEKSPKREIEVAPINIDKIPEGGIEILQDNERITLVLHDTTAQKKDTLALKINMFDRMIHNKARKVVEKIYKDTIFAMYKIPYQKIKSVEFVATDTMRFVFAQKLKDTPKLSLIDFESKGENWYTFNIGNNGDTLFIISQDSDFLKMDTIKYTITYQNIDKKEMPIIQTDTLSLKRPLTEKTQTPNRGRRRSELGMDNTKKQDEARKNMAKANLRFPLPYSIDVDTMNSKNRIISYDFEPGKEYLLEIDDSTFNSIYGTPNLYLSSKGKIRQLDYYGEMMINIKNVGMIERYPDIDEDLPPFEEIDTSRTLHRRINPNDTIAATYTEMTEGQLLICLCGGKGEIKYKKAVACDSLVKFDFILPGDYNVKVIHDRNSNGKWDTGKFIEQQYPERSVEHPKKQTVKSKWTTELEWKL